MSVKMTDTRFVASVRDALAAGPGRLSRLGDVHNMHRSGVQRHEAMVLLF